jgi:hypothetical protein
LILDFVFANDCAYLKFFKCLFFTFSHLPFFSIVSIDQIYHRCTYLDIVLKSCLEHCLRHFENFDLNFFCLLFLLKLKYFDFQVMDSLFFLILTSCCCQSLFHFQICLKALMKLCFLIFIKQLNFHLCFDGLLKWVFILIFKSLFGEKYLIMAALSISFFSILMIRYPSIFLIDHHYKICSPSFSLISLVFTLSQVFYPISFPECFMVNKRFTLTVCYRFDLLRIWN